MSSPARRRITTAAAAAMFALVTAGCGIGQYREAATTSIDDAPPDPATPAGSAAGPAETDTSAEPDAPESDAPEPDATLTAAADQEAFVAGAYDTQVDYEAPSGSQQMGVTLTIEADGTITDVEITPDGADGNSMKFQKRFARDVPAVVVGRSIADLAVPKVAGASLTVAGFNAAIEQIADQARA